MKTFGQVLDANKGLGPGFDAVRLGLAFSVIAFHSAVIVGTLDALMASPLWIVPKIIVPMFFAVSGFLITGSAQRLKLGDFLLNRGARLLPGLALVTLVCTFVLGPIFTTTPLPAYFASPEVARYLLTATGWIQHHLPGVYADHPSNAVNLSLWTVPYEVACYVAMAGMALLGLLARPRLLLALTIAFILTPIGIELAHPEALWKPLQVLFFSRGSCSFQCFLAGGLFYLYRDRIPLKGAWALASALVVAAIALIGDVSLDRSAVVNALLTPTLSYATLFLGLSRIPDLPLYDRGDYSYGIYLYGFPAQQVMWAALPIPQTWWMNILLTIPVVTVCAMLSWHGVEKPALQMRKKVSLIGRRLAETLERSKASALQDERAS